MSLFDPSGNILQSDKADLAKILGNDATFENLPPLTIKSASLIDGQALVQAIGKPVNSNTFGDLADAYLKTVYNKVGTRVDVAFKRYL